MNLSKVNVLIIALLIIVASGCLKPRSSESGNGAVTNESLATFQIKDEMLSDWYAEIGNVAKKWDRVLSKNYTYSIVLQDLKNNSKNLAAGFSFEIEDPSSKKMFTATTKSGGTLTWREDNVTYNDIADAKYLIEERVVRAVGNSPFKGSVTFNFYRNPWEQSSSQILKNPTELQNANTATPEQIALSSRGINETGEFVERKNIIIDKINIETNQQQESTDGIIMGMKISFNPKISKIDSNKRETTEPIKKGEFRVYLSLVNTHIINGEKNSYLLSSYASPDFITYNDGTFVDDGIKVHIKEAPTHGTLEAYIRIVPSTGLSEAIPFEAVFTLGNATGYVGKNHSSALTPTQNNYTTKEFSLDKILSDLNQSQYSKKDLGIMPTKPFEIGLLNFRFLRFISEKETATQRTMLFNVSTQVRYSYNQKFIASERDFEIYRLDKTTGEEILIQRPVLDDSGSITSYENSWRTNQQGELRWDDTLTHNYYVKEQRYKRTYRLKEVLSKSFYEKIALFNPWDIGWTFGTDKDSSSTVGLKIENAISPTLFINSYNYQALGIRYELDDNLNLNVKKAILLRIKPKILRYGSLTNGRKEIEPLRDGIYLLKVALQKNYFDGNRSGIKISPSKKDVMFSQFTIEDNVKNRPIEFLSIVKKLIRVQAGQIIAPLEFTISDLRVMRSRANLLIQIEPIDEHLLNLNNNTSFSDLGQKEINDKLRTLYRNKALEMSNSANQTLDTGFNEEQIINAMSDTNDALKAVAKTISEPNILDWKVAKKKIAESLSENTNETGTYSWDKDKEIIVDLEKFIDKNTILGKSVDGKSSTRTFVGPIILLSNNFSAGLMPTDELDIAEHVGSSIMKITLDDKESSIKDSNDILQFKNKTVDDYISRSYEINWATIFTKKYNTLLSHYLDKYRLNYVAMNDEPLPKLKSKDGTCGSLNLEDCLVREDKNELSYSKLKEWLNFKDRPGLNKSTTWDYSASMPFKRDAFRDWDYHDKKYFLNTMPEYLDNYEPLKIGDKEIVDFIETGLIDQNMTRRMCYLFTYYLAGEKISFDKTSVQREIYHQCLKFAMPDQQNAFAIGRHLRVKEIGDYHYQDGQTLNFNIYSGFNLNYGETISRGVSINPLKWIKQIGSMVGGMVGGTVGSTIAGNALGVINDTITFTTNGSTSNGYTLGSSVSSGIYLAMQQAQLGIKFNVVEKCASIRFNSFFLEKSDVIKKLENNLDENRLHKAVTEGIFICKGEDEQINEYYPEKYYYFTQNISDTDLIDHDDLQNYPWLLALRGERDYVNFVSLIKGSHNQVSAREMQTDLFGIAKHKYKIDGGVKWYFDNRKEIEASYIAKDSNLANDPIDQLTKTYEQVAPTFPGIYTMGPDFNQENKTEEIESDDDLETDDYIKP